MDSLIWLIDTSGFTPRSHCGAAWTPELQLAHQVCEVVIFLAYLIIPFGFMALYRTIESGQAIRYHKLGTVLFGGFILTCGLSHLVSRIMFQWPAYRLSALVLAVCASFSIAACAWFLLALGGKDGR